MSLSCRSDPLLIDNTLYGFICINYDRTELHFNQHLTLAHCELFRFVTVIEASEMPWYQYQLLLLLSHYWAYSTLLQGRCRKITCPWKYRETDHRIPLRTDIITQTKQSTTQPCVKYMGCTCSISCDSDVGFWATPLDYQYTRECVNWTNGTNSLGFETYQEYPE